MQKLGILGSTRGTDMLALLAAIHDKKISSCIEVVISNKQNAMILERARAHHLHAEFVDPTGLTREAYDKKISDILCAHDVDIIVLIGYMRILSNEFVKTWRNQIINVHPSLLPEFAGGMDQNIHQAVLDAQQNETGCTVHYVTEEVDAGPILIQKKCPVLPTDTVESLKARVQKLEGEALIEALINIKG
jgi:phosphoribosylglycinamide formyltransferase-1